MVQLQYNRVDGVVTIEHKVDRAGTIEHTVDGAGMLEHSRWDCYKMGQLHYNPGDETVMLEYS